MSKLLNHVIGNFTQIPNHLINDISLSAQSRFLYVYLAMRPTGWNFNNIEIMKTMCCKRGALTKYFNELTDSGWITKTQAKFEDGKFGNNIIELNVSSNTDAQKTYTGNPLLKNTVAQKNRNGKKEPLINTELNINTETGNKKERSLTRNFKPPLINEVDEYCRERKNNVDAQRWFDFYTSKGWMIGKTKMKDWKAAVRTWENRQNTIPSQQNLFGTKSTVSNYSLKDESTKETFY